MGNLAPIAFDIETSGLDSEAVITVAGLAAEMGEVLILNTAGRSADQRQLERTLVEYSAGGVDLTVVGGESKLLGALAESAENYLNEDRHYLTAYHGETWKGGFDLPFVRTACVRHSIEWPFPSIAYADVMNVVDRFETQGQDDLVSVYQELIGRESCDPFADSSAAVDTFEDGDWEPLLKHNISDIQRTRELAVLAGAYVPQSDFRMKNLEPPSR